MKGKFTVTKRFKNTSKQKRSNPSKDPPTSYDKTEKRKSETIETNGKSFLCVFPVIKNFSNK